MHYIKVKTVNEILLKSIKEITDFAKEEKQEFLKVMNKLSDEKREEKYQEDKEKLEKLSSRNEELLITQLTLSWQLRTAAISSPTKNSKARQSVSKLVPQIGRAHV